MWLTTGYLIQWHCSCGGAIFAHEEDLGQAPAALRRHDAYLPAPEFAEFRSETNREQKFLGHHPAIAYLGRLCLAFHRLAQTVFDNLRWLLPVYRGGAGCYSDEANF